MDFLRHLIITVVMVAMAAPSAQAQSGRINLRDAVASSARLTLMPVSVPQQQPPVLAALHPAAKGAIIGAAAGAGAVGAIGLWYCTVGPSESGECGSETWGRAIPLWAGIGAGIGMLIGALR